MAEDSLREYIWAAYKFFDPQNIDTIAATP